MLRTIYESLFHSSSLHPPFSQEIIQHNHVNPLSLTTAGNHKIGFDDICYIVKTKTNPNVLLINTLPIQDQENIILGTISYQAEETTINNILTDYTKKPSQYTIIIYGRNCSDDSVDKKYKQLLQLGFTNVFIYYGGMFEWMLLQDVYGTKYFPTTKNEEKDPLKYMAKRKLFV